MVLTGSDTLCALVTELKWDMKFAKKKGIRNQVEVRKSGTRCIWSNPPSGQYCTVVTNYIVDRKVHSHFEWELKVHVWSGSGICVGFIAFDHKNQLDTLQCANQYCGQQPIGYCIYATLNPNSTWYLYKQSNTLMQVPRCTFVGRLTLSDCRVS